MSRGRTIIRVLKLVLGFFIAMVLLVASLVIP
jgi:hypothetical protein